MFSKNIVLSFAAILLATQMVFAQVPTPSTKAYTGSFGGGIALTGGNTDTKNINLTFDLVGNLKTKNVFKMNAIYLRGTETDIVSVDRAAISVRDERTISDRIYGFGQMDYMRDQFKQIIFLWAPVGGIGYRFIKNEATQFTVDGGAGGFLEKNPGTDASRSGSVSAGEKFQQKLSSTASFTESFGTIWKTQDFGDSLTNFSLGLTTSVAKKLEVKIGFIDSLKKKPPSAAVKQNDTAFVTAFVVKF